MTEDFSDLGQAALEIQEGLVLSANDAALRLLPPIERALLAKSRHMNLFLELDSVKDLYLVSEWLKREGATVYDVEMGKTDKAGVSYVTGLFSVKLPQRRDHNELLAALSMLPGDEYVAVCNHDSNEIRTFQVFHEDRPHFVQLFFTSANIKL